MIDKGKAHGVERGMAILFENVLVGKVVRVNKYTSLILLPRNPDSKLLVITRDVGEGKGVKARGLLVGERLDLVLEKVLTGEALDKGDLVLTAGDEDLPPELLIGEVAEVVKIEGEVYQKAKVEPWVEVGDLETVFVLISR